MTAMTLSGPLADRDSWTANHCSIDKAMGVVGTRSAVLILREAYYGATRFDQFASRVGITEAVASARLKELTEAGLFVKSPYRDPGQRTRYEYLLTEMGDDLLPVVLGLMQWGDKHLQSGRGPLVVTDGNGRVQVEVRSTDGRAVAADDLEVRARTA
ncbi:MULTISPECIES: winged helix-turn-helix transcriptional regulator [Nocardiaceae]|uniref:winged helix-turn-helix transcriptional regulator n=1 Tax=Nocardiaceae TaxID=85025 RepID=UPI00037E0F27|nr:MULTISPECIES: helix-turn-helix domain-containing protein [Rhodococcus]OZD15145.1 transcriptional regulator [Rhodococcus sp. 06-156-4C]OZD19768.1 transcriptional regulator [Rhodococcus sp. 06-156-4a]OZD22922.1 transcriptional regulator [Rhodococcus sp. 06-156-3C]OZD25787.1 transcriptional regulator [Rhodococcus sp. 06-156-3b]OZD37993.1 transcriptional regulator [Rhodococcus sp. 06-156-3]